MEQPVDHTPIAEPTVPRMVIVRQLRRQLEDVMAVDDHEILDPPDKRIIIRGHIRGDTEAAFETISERLAALGYTPMLRDWPGGGGHELLAVKQYSERKTGRLWLNLVLFLATVVSVLFIGGGYALEGESIDVPQGFPGNLLGALVFLYRGLPFAGTLLGILLAHELSHYFVGRRYGSPVSLPFFIPMLNIFGTMGAVIVQRRPMRSRKIMLDIGIAGPLGGLIVAIPLLILGLSLSSVGPIPTDVDTVYQEGNSLLYLALKYLVFGRILPKDGIDVWLHPVAFAAWGGLWITMMNLVPVGQLDGGHISYALLGRRALSLGRVAIGAMIVWGMWLLASTNGAGWIWFTWGLLNLALNRRHPSPLDDATRPGWPRIALGILMVIVFVLLFMPAPIQIVDVH